MWMPVPLYLSGVVENFAFIELEQISADFENYHFSKVSIHIVCRVPEKLLQPVDETFYDVIIKNPAGNYTGRV